MKSKVLLIIAILAISWQTAFSQFETVWDKKLPNNIKTVSFSHDSKWLMAWISPNSIIFNTELGELVNDKIPASINYPSFSNDDSHIFGINDNRIIHYNIKTGKDDSIFEPSNYPITEYVITKNEQFIIGLINTYNPLTSNHFIQIHGIIVWNIQTGKILNSKTYQFSFDGDSLSRYDWNLYQINYSGLHVNCNNDEIFVQEVNSYGAVDIKQNPIYKSNTVSKKLYFQTLDSIALLQYFGYLSNDCQYIAYGIIENESYMLVIRNSNNTQIISSMKIGDQSIRLAGIRFTQDDKYLVTASSAGADIWEVSSGKFIKKAKVGTLYTLDISNDDKYGATSIGEYLYVFKLIGINSVPFDSLSIETIYHNPSTGDISINFILPQSSNVSLKLFDLNGSAISQLFDGILNIGENTLKFNMNQYPSGIYFITINSLNLNKTYKLILNK